MLWSTICNLWWNNSTEFFSEILLKFDSLLLVLLNILWHQLLSMDDMEFKQGLKSLSIEQFSSLALFLKDLLYHLSWINPVNEMGSSDFSNQRLFQIQLLRIGCKVFNHLITRNERLQYSSPDKWTWPSFSSHEFDVSK